MSRRLRWTPAAGAFALLLGASVAAFVGAELLLRLFVPASRFMDRDRDDYWAALCRERLERLDPDQVEIGNVRLDPQLGWRMRPGFRTDGENIDSRGLRGLGEHVPGPAGACRILMLGDSFTFGLGVRDEETFAAVLDREHSDCTVINAGANGWGTDQQYLFWRIEGRDYEPDVVVLGFYVPDFHRNSLTIREFPKPWFALEGDRLVASQPPVPTPLEYCDSERFQKRSWSRLGDAIGAVVRRFRGGEEPARFVHKAELITAILRDLKVSVEGAGAQLRVVTIPHEQGRQYADHLEIEGVIENACKHYAITCLNLTEPFEAAGATMGEESFYGPNNHWNPAGHEYAAALIAEFLNASE